MQTQNGERDFTTVVGKSNLTNTGCRRGLYFFFDNFKKDSLFQSARIDSPLKVVTHDSGFPEESFKNVHFVSFSKREWGGEVYYHINRVASDTVTVTLEVEDTGIYVEHFFVLRSGHWFLFQIIDSST